MKNLRLFLLAILILPLFTACNDDDGDYPKYGPMIVTVHTLDTNASPESSGSQAGYYFLRDNGDRLLAGDISRIRSYRATDGQRAIIWFSLIDRKASGYDYNLKLYGVEDIYTGTSSIVTTQSDLDLTGDAATSIWPDETLLSRGWLTLYVGYASIDNSKHDFTVIVNKLDTPEETAEGYLNVELRHKNGGETSGTEYAAYISLDLTPLQAELNGKKGIILKVQTRQSGTKYLKYDLPVEK